MTIILVKVHQFVTNFELSAKEPFERGYTKQCYESLLPTVIHYDSM